MTGTLRDHRRTSGTSREFVWFSALTSVVYLAWIAMVHTARFNVHPDALSWGAALDLTVTVPLAYWLLVVRRARASRRSILAVVALSVFGAKLLLPAGHTAFLPWVRFATVPTELGIFALAISRVRASRRASAVRDDMRDSDMRDSDMLTQLQSTLAMFVIETPILHLLVAHGSTRVAWILTAASVYSIVWLVAFQRSAGQRLSVLRPDALALRIGLRCDATVPWDNVASVRLVSWRHLPARSAGYLNTAKPSNPNVLIEFHDPVRIEGPYGIPRTVTRLGVRLERPEVFVSRAAARVST